MGIGPEQIRPLYEAALREYLGKGTDQNAMLDAAPDADKASLQETAPKPKEQIISELVPKIQMQGMTPARAIIAAQEMYAKAEKHFGDSAEVVLEAYQPGQDPGKFLDGFQNAYIAGKLGNKAALENSTATAYLTQEQRMAAYEMGAGVKNTRPVEYREKRDIITKDKGKTLSPDVQINIPKEKFTAYALDPQKSPDKAKAFKLALGYDLSNYEALIENILENIDVSKFVEKGDRGHGMRYEYILELRGVNGKKANVLTAWISDGEGIRLVTVYVTNKDVRK